MQPRRGRTLDLRLSTAAPLLPANAGLTDDDVVSASHPLVRRNRDGFGFENPTYEGADADGGYVDVGPLQPTNSPGAKGREIGNTEQPRIIGGISDFPSANKSRLGILREP